MERPNELFNSAAVERPKIAAGLEFFVDDSVEGCLVEKERRTIERGEGSGIEQIPIQKPERMEEGIDTYRGMIPYRTSRRSQVSALRGVQGLRFLDFDNMLERRGLWNRSLSTCEQSGLWERCAAASLRETSVKTVDLAGA